MRSSVGGPSDGEAEDARESARSSSSFWDRGDGILLKEEIEVDRDCGGLSEVGDAGPEPLCAAFTSLKIWTVSDADETQRSVDVALNDML